MIKLPNSSKNEIRELMVFTLQLHFGYPDPVLYIGHSEHSCESQPLAQVDATHITDMADLHIS